MDRFSALAHTLSLYFILLLLLQGFLSNLNLLAPFIPIVHLHKFLPIP